MRNRPLGVLRARETARSAELQAACGGLVEPPGSGLGGDAAGWGLVHGAAVGEGAGHRFGLALAGDEEPDLAGAVEGGEGERDPLGWGLRGASYWYGDALGVELGEAREQRRDVAVRA